MRRITFRVLFRVVVILFIVYAAYNLIALQEKLNEKQAEYQTLQEQITEQKLENQRLEENSREELDDEEIASIAREKLGYSLPGERVFIDITGK